MDVAEIIELMEKVAPGALAEPWDNVGLQLGSQHWPVELIWVALDPDPRVIRAAAQAGVDLLIAHHPLILEPLKRLDLDTPWGAAMGIAIRHQLAIFSAHTNLDAARGGINDLLAQHLELGDLSPLISLPSRDETGAEFGQTVPQAAGMGRIGWLAQPFSLMGFGAKVKQAFPSAASRVVGDRDITVEQVAVCSGSGGGLLPQFLASRAQVFVTGDIKYHQAREIELAGKALIDIGHFASEHIFIDPLVERLRSLLPAGEQGCQIEACLMENDPFGIL